jgi:hypothetical protein
MFFEPPLPTRPADSTCSSAVIGFSTPTRFVVCPDYVFRIQALVAV